MVRRIVIAGFAVLLPTIVQGQGRGVMSAAPRPVAVGPRVVAHASLPVTSPPMLGARVLARSNTPRSRMVTPVLTPRNTRRPAGTRRRFDAEDRHLKPGCSTVPGLGFDMVHLAAVCGPEAVEGGRFGNQFPFFFPFFDSGFSIPSSPAVAEQGAVAEPQESDAADNEVSNAPRRARVAQAPASAAEPEQAAPGATDEYVFVRRDGTVFFAVGYVWEKGTLRYVTREGLRRSVTRDALDLDATQQFNEQRGLSFRLPV